MLRYPVITTSPRIRTSPSSASLISTPGTGFPTVPSLIRSDGVSVPAPLVSGVLPRPAHAEGVEDLEHVARRRRGADVHRDGLVEPEHRAQHGEDAGVGPCHPLGKVEGGGIAGLLAGDLLGRCREALLRPSR